MGVFDTFRQRVDRLPTEWHVKQGILFVVLVAILVYANCAAGGR